MKTRFKYFKTKLYVRYIKFMAKILIYLDYYTLPLRTRIGTVAVILMGYEIGERILFYATSPNYPGTRLEFSAKIIGGRHIPNVGARIVAIEDGCGNSWTVQASHIIERNLAEDVIGKDNRSKEDFDRCKISVQSGDGSENKADTPSPLG